MTDVEPSVVEVGAESFESESQETPTTDIETGGYDEDHSEEPDTEEGETSGETEQEKIERELLKLKVNGEEVDYDISDKEKLAKDLQLSMAAQEKFTKASEIQRNFESLQANISDFGAKLKASPMEILQQIGLDPRKIAEDYLAPIYERLDLPEHERVALEQKEQMEKMQSELMAYKQAEAEKQKQALVQQKAEHYRQQIKRMIKDNGLPDTEDTLYYIATAYNRELGRNPKAQLNDILPVVQSTMQQNISGYISGLDEEGLIKALGKDSVAKIRKYYAKNSTASKNKFKGNRGSGDTGYSRPRQSETRVKGDAETLAELGL